MAKRKTKNDLEREILDLTEVIEETEANASRWEDEAVRNNKEFESHLLWLHELLTPMMHYDDDPLLQDERHGSTIRTDRTDREWTRVRLQVYTRIGALVAKEREFEELKDRVLDVPQMKLLRERREEKRFSGGGSILGNGNGPGPMS